MEAKVVLFLIEILALLVCGYGEDYVSVLGDPGMKNKRVRVALEGWNQCNEVGAETPGMGSPRYADCSELECPSESDIDKERWRGCKVNHRVKATDNRLSAGDPFPNSTIQASKNVDQYAVEKELYLGSLCEVDSGSDPWQFWNIMLKNGNFDVNSTLCPNNGKREDPIRTDRHFPCFGKGCMNQPIVHHTWSQIKSGNGLTGSFYGTYDLDADLKEGIDNNVSYYSVVWEKNPATGGWVFSHKLKTSRKYPWLMLYLRADATRGYSGGYHYETRGMMKQLPESPNFKVRLTLDVKQGGGPSSQFYLVDIGSCWKNDGRPCDGDVETDVTRYTEMIINPSTASVCSPEKLDLCPPYHITASGTKINRNDTEHFPYTAYHLHCSPGNAKYLEEPFNLCDPYSNPQAQEIMQLLPHPEWAVHGYPSKKGDGWIGDSRTWELDVGGLSNRLYFYQDPGTKPARRVWTSVDVGTEIYISPKDEIAEWTLSDFDVLVPVAESDNA